VLAAGSYKNEDDRRHLSNESTFQGVKHNVLRFISFKELREKLNLTRLTIEGLNA